jgi:hypothetical protein
MDLCDCQPANGETEHRHYCNSFDVLHITGVLVFVSRRGNRVSPGQAAKTLGRCWKVRSSLEMASSKCEMSSPKREMNGL